MIDKARCIMKVTLPGSLLLLAVCTPLHAAAIDLQCKELAQQLIERLDAEGLLSSSSGDAQQRARAIGLELCTGAQATAEQQHEQDKQKALDNWWLEAPGDKPGNERLKNFKR
jgi:hypothetical protein